MAVERCWTAAANNSTPLIYVGRRTCCNQLILLVVFSVGCRVFKKRQNKMYSRSVYNAHILRHCITAGTQQCTIPATNRAARVLSTKQTEVASTLVDEVAIPQWRPIYRLPLIRIASAFNRLKIYQAALTLAGTPLAFALESAGQLPAHIASIYGIVGATGLITLTLGSYAIQNLIGLIYINNEADKLKFAYVDFWGRRQHTHVEINDLIPPWEKARPPRFDFYQVIYLHSDAKRKYKLLQRFGVIMEASTFVSLFGE